MIKQVTDEGEEVWAPRERRPTWNGNATVSARVLAFLILFLVSLLSVGAQSVPSLVNYQGRLANPDGSPLPTADYTLTFNVYDAATNGALVWGPQVFDGAVAQGHGARIPVVQGYFNVMLGPSDTPGRALSDAFNGTSRFVEVTVSNRPPILPRQQILTTPFAFQAANSAKLAGYDWSALLGTNNPVAGTIPFSKLAQRQVGTNVGVGGIAVSESTGMWNSPTPYQETLVPSLQVTMQTRNSGVQICLAAGSTNTAEIFATSNTGTRVPVQIVLRRDGVVVQRLSIADHGAGVSDWPPSLFSFVDFPPAGQHVYTISVGYYPEITQLGFSNIRLIAYEL